MILLAALLATAAPGDVCAKATAAQIADVRITKATPVSANQHFRAGDPRAAPVEAAFCRVEGLIEKEIGFELWLPVTWNGHLLAGGVGGQAGNYNFRELARGTSRGYASASTDTGHKASDRHWLLGDPARAANYAERANHLLAIKAKALIAAAYGKPATRAIFSGCSGGGRQAMTEAQRYPTDYDGIIAGAPGVDTPAMSARRMWEMVQHSRYAGLMRPADWSLIASAATAACDGKDGVKDGVVENPARCTFRIAALACKPGAAKTDACLTPDQIALAERLYAPLHDENGKRIDDGLLPGVPVSATPLPEPFAPGPPYLAVALFGDGVHRDPNWNPATFRLADDLPAIDTVMNLHADDPDLTPFTRNGGKLILYQGWLDPLVAAQSTIGYYGAVRRRMGAKAAQAAVRLYLVPGMDHCQGGNATDGFGNVGNAGLDDAPDHDLLSAMESWLDNKGTPERLVAVKRDGDRIIRTRPLCPWPQQATYRGGNPDKAESFACGPQKP